MDLPDPGIKPGSPALLADSLPAELSGKPFSLFNMSYNCPTLFSLHVNKYLPVIAGIKQDIWKSMLSVQYPWPQYPGSLKGDQDNRRLSLGFFHRWKREVLQFWSSYILYYILNVIYTLQYAFFANINY